MAHPRLYSIIGPTASGKTSLGIQLALHLDGEVVSCDSRQIYKGMNIGTGKVTTEEMQGIPHHLLDIAEPTDAYSVADYQQAAFLAIDDIIARGKQPILVGGTGQYYSAVIEHWDFSSGASSESKLPPRYCTTMYTPDVSREALYKQINDRVIKMLDYGFLDEVRHLVTKYGYDAYALQHTIGYTELCHYLQKPDLYTFNQVVEQIQQNTRHYAKRQYTWFRRYYNTLTPVRTIEDIICSLT